MATRNPFDPTFAQLPTTLPIFPLSGALLLPGGRLPLNIFEPRYLAMVFDALGSHRMIGMVHPMRPGGFAGDGLPEDLGGPPPVHGIGCAGRIVQFAETDDGRVVLSLLGVARFDIRSELPLHAHGWRPVMPDFARFAGDLAWRGEKVELDRERLQAALQAYFRARQLDTDWDAVAKTADNNLVTSLSMLCPFGPAEKQALLEATDSTVRARLLIAFLEMGAFGGTPQAPVSRH
jgi:Lon protease-like protein